MKKPSYSFKLPKNTSPEVLAAIERLKLFEPVKWYLLLKDGTKVEIAAPIIKDPYRYKIADVKMAITFSIEP